MNRIKELRERKNLTQQELADNLGISKRTLGYWEKGEVQIKPDKAEKMANYFGVPLGYLLGYSNYEDNDKLFDDFYFAEELKNRKKEKEVTKEQDHFFQKYIDQYPDLNFTFQKRLTNAMYKEYIKAHNELTSMLCALVMSEGLTENSQKEIDSIKKITEFHYKKLHDKNLIISEIISQILVERDNYKK